MFNRLISVILERISSKQAVEPTKKSRIIKFYENEPVISSSKTLHKIWEWSDSKLEMNHDYIQWLFPTDRVSSFNPVSETLSTDDINVFRNNSAYQDSLKRSLTTYFSFLGIEWSGEFIVKSEFFADKSKIWLTKNNHNYLRISRILRCLKLLGKENDAISLFVFLCDLKDEHPEMLHIPYQFWKKEVCVRS